ncbi:MAG TPA: hypothetical protein VNN22_22950 [Verrucomicrobiae bacterium]|nr:hypothetical protein [Verrucomicrobiae bacterium]
MKCGQAIGLSPPARCDWRKRKLTLPNFPELAAAGPKLESILETDVPDKYTLSDHLWK